jgi:hypothetical protein
VIHNKVVMFAALPAAPGLVAVAGGAALHDALEFSSGTGVGMGSPDQNGFPAGRGGVFGSANGAGNIAQIQLVPTLNPATEVPKVGNFGDLYRLARRVVCPLKVNVAFGVKLRHGSKFVPLPLRPSKQTFANAIGTSVEGPRATETRCPRYVRLSFNLKHSLRWKRAITGLMPRSKCSSRARY